MLRIHMSQYEAILDGRARHLFARLTRRTPAKQLKGLLRVLKKHGSQDSVLDSRRVRLPAMPLRRLVQRRRRFCWPKLCLL